MKLVYLKEGRKYGGRELRECIYRQLNPAEADIARPVSSAAVNWGGVGFRQTYWLESDLLLYAEVPGFQREDGLFGRNPR